MSDTSVFFTARPAYPWSLYPGGLAALGVVALLLIGLTIWTYLGHPQATRKRILTVLALRLAALAVTLLTALRPSVGIQEEPKVPSVLLLGIDLSESMTVQDEVNSQARIAAVRKVLEKCQPTLDELANEQNVTVVMYRFAGPDFSPEASRYDPAAPADGKRSDYGTYLNRALDKYQGERFLRGHLLIGDGADNGTAFSAVAEAARWGKRNCPVTTFTVGSDDTKGDAKDIAVVALSCDPSPAGIKTDVTVTGRVNAYGFAGTRVKARVLIDGKEERVEEVLLAKERDNEVKITMKAPATAGEVKVRLEIPELPGEVSKENNWTETYLTVTKEGVRVLVIDRLRNERLRIMDCLRADKRFDVYEVIRQTNLPPTPDEAQWLDLDNQGYDVVIVGNVSYDQLISADPKLPEKLIDRVGKKGMGLMFLGGEAAFVGMPLRTPATPKDATLLADLLPVVPLAGQIIDAPKNPPGFQTVPTPVGFQRFVMRVGKDEAESRALWDQLNGPTDRRYYRITGANRFDLKPAARSSVLAWASGGDQAIPAQPFPDKGGYPLLVSGQYGDGDRGRVLAFAGFDTYYWEQLGQPKTRLGVEIHNRFWKQAVLWLAHQEEEEGQVYARPEFRRLPVGGDQTVRVGLKSPTGDDPNAELDVRVLPPGQQDRPEDEDKAAKQPVLRDAKGAKVLFKPPTAGEYTVVVTSPIKDKDGKPVMGPDGKQQKYRGTARFISYPDVSDEMIKVAADHAHLEKIAGASGGKALRLEDLPGYLKELKGQPLESVKPKPRFLPDWRRNHSKGFLPLWLVLFVALLGVEWGLRRVWGMV